MCFRPGDGIVERPLAPRPPTARTAEPVLAQLGSEQTAAASLGPMPSETAGCTLNFSADTLQKKQKDLRKSSRETSA